MFHRDGQPFRVIQALEAFAVLVAFLVLEAPSLVVGAGCRVTVTLPGWTDNLGNTNVITTLMVTQFPACVVIMELAAQLELYGARLD